MDYTLELEIDLPRGKVAEVFDDEESLPFWQPGFVKLEAISGEPGKEGAKSRLLYLNGKQEVELIEAITAGNLPEEFSAIFEAKGMRMEVKNRFEELGPERTRWTSGNDAGVKGIMLNLMTVTMSGCFRKQSLKLMENFKVYAETGADCRDSAWQKIKLRERFAIGIRRE